MPGKLTRDEFIKRSNKVHNDKYTYENVVYINNSIKVIINCGLHGDFLQKPNDHMTHGCQKCGEIKSIESRKKTFDAFINDAKLVHKDKYNYDNFVYINNDTKGEIKCNIHDIFLQSPKNHITRGCIKCGYIKTAEAKKNTIDDFITNAKKTHNDKYNYDNFVYINNDTKGKIKCNIHGIFLQSPSNHMTHGCKKCGNIKISESKKNTIEDFIIKAKLVHGDKYTYDDYIYIDYKTKGKIKCSIHGIFLQSSYQHIRNKTGCLKCNMCPLCGLWRTMGKLCDYCKPKNQNKLYQKTKEMEIVRFLKDKLPDNEFIHNKSVGSDCTDGRLYPDILFDCNWYFLIVEIDEFQHRGANYSCDEKRMHDIIAKLGLPCIFIRYNPDNKKSDKQHLLNKVTEYLNLTDKIWNDFGFKAEYLFYNLKT